jgi:hypothetical protein
LIRRVFPFSPHIYLLPAISGDIGLPSILQNKRLGVALQAAHLAHRCWFSLHPILNQKPA